MNNYLPMYDNFTHNHLILYYFNETDLPDTVITQQHIDTYPEVEEEYDSIVKTMEKIEQALVSPSQESINKILAYSKAVSG